ncbi:MAG: hypothetical protein GSR78_02435, partial [Desulfurococcales archaeon]|nr:hypothetical protein [Desulfurococcales archaeon]
MAESSKLNTRLIAAVVVALLVGLVLGAFMFKGGEEQAAAGEAQITEQTGETTGTTTGGGEQATGGEQAATGQQEEAQTGEGSAEEAMNTGREQAEGEMAPEQPPVEEVAKAVNLRVNVGRAAGLGLALQGYTSVAVIAQD